MKLFTLTAGLLAGLLSHSLSAQNDKATRELPYWNLSVSEEGKTPTIRFFSAENRLMYEEELPKEMASLTQQNVNLFNEVLYTVMNRRLVSSQLSNLNSGDLMTLKSNYYTSKQVWYKNGVASLMANPEMKSPGKLSLYYCQLDKKLVNITLTDDTGELVHFQDQSKRTTYLRMINIQGLPTGNYRLTIHHPEQEIRYQISVNKAQNSYSIQYIK
ncbi:hypothetical protein [Siphonobacter sp. SORGH_AS_1065]|uniref:hypothetical protein n=1 Tax=Siphonobacter sp. SORGH_AS_1065 TaxID=3041795 RepID=UPI00277F22D5|nr:hypothetical protein [Siphonobacter sp. SORGH_AS_1065]MDQ1089765.1 hypothetical protein [Siphonobacter sp. SORGH_AS_1065]